jgi:thiamine kinase-like enzyme
MGTSPGVRFSVKIDLSKYALFAEQKVQYGNLLEDQGHCNVNHLLHTPDQKYLLREFKLAGPDRKLEFKIQQKAYRKGIAGKPCVLDENNGIMICEFVEGVHKHKLDRNEIRRIAKLLQKLHHITIRTKPINLKHAFTSKPIEVKQAFKSIAGYKLDHVICHNDLNPKNILFSHRIKLIDWEYATINDRYFDLASLCVEFDFNRREENYLFQAYFGRSSKVDKMKLDAYKVIYEVLCTQWFEENERENQT